MADNVIIGWRRALGLSALFGLAPAAAVPQDLGPGGLQYRFTAAQSFTAETDFALQSLGSGGAGFGATELAFGISSETRTQRIALTAGTTFRLAPSFTQPGSNDASDPFVQFDYRRDAARSGLQFSASHMRDAIAFTDVYTGVIGDDGTLLPLSAPDDFEGAGTRSTSVVTARMDTGRDMPLAFDFGVSAILTEYSETTDPDLEDSLSVSADIGARLALSSAVTGRFRLEVASREEDDLADTRSESTSLLFGVDYEPTSTFSLSAELGPIWEQERSFGITTDDTGLTGSLSAVWSLPQSELSLSFSGSDVADDSSFATSLDWSRTNRNGLFVARASYDVAPGDATDPEETTAFLGMGYLFELNSLSQLGLALAFSSTDTEGDPRSEPSFSIGASYRRDLGRNTALHTGYEFRTRDEILDGSSSSHSIFMRVTFDTEGLF
ncbi:hypothetical protein GCM10007385_15700 [Tateyamaria omphalii]|uniref:hypothetical protein n=1 Tax=Tateyamaria omphalii TaxID=299262 RepID=UPI001675A027|nr:hypothetical protein [Tateyamaria omphalii]GGX48570.1 hypothetical protein GCM10007385_15700 [Tateyamaria omphalii]